MDKTDRDVLTQVLDDEESKALLVKALQDKLKDNPVDFYKNFIEPRSGKMQEPGTGTITRTTVIEEVERMSQATAPKEKDAETDT